MGRAPLVGWAVKVQASREPLGVGWRGTGRHRANRSDGPRHGPGCGPSTSRYSGPCQPGLVGQQAEPGLGQAKKNWPRAGLTGSGCMAITVEKDQESERGGC